MVAQDADGGHDARFRLFHKAPLIVPNNDVKAHTNIERSREYAESAQKAIVWSQAKDVASASVLQTKPMTSETELQWLQRHDKESGDLYGMLPLVEGMPDMLAGHLDRNPAKNLLRGSRGNIVGWIEHPEEDNTKHQSDEQSRVLTKVPLAVFVKFDNAKWTLPGVGEPGVYPVRPHVSRVVLG